MNRQNAVADQHDYTRLKTSSQVRKFVDLGLLVRVPGNPDYELAGVSYPYARPEVKLFLERLARQFRAATGQKLVVTSLTRPLTRQPRNASDQSVHTTGMAIDLRRPRARNARKWLERTLLSLENANVLEATHERHPPHYHVAVFPRQYAAYVERKTGGTPELASKAAPPTSPPPAPPKAPSFSRPAPDYSTYTVSGGDSLWGIARKFGTSIDRIQKLNGIETARIQVGQKLLVPGG